MRDFARGVKKRSGSDQDNSLGEPSHATHARRSALLAAT
jgi:hypothetical protein